jgi:hypothetical protein
MNMGIKNGKWKEPILGTGIRNSNNKPSKHSHVGGG